MVSEFFNTKTQLCRGGVVFHSFFFARLLALIY
jgi:hypothetical protein